MQAPGLKKKVKFAASTKPGAPSPRSTGTILAEWATEPSEAHASTHHVTPQASAAQATAEATAEEPAEEEDEPGQYQSNIMDHVQDVHVQLIRDRAIRYSVRPKRIDALLKPSFDVMDDKLKCYVEVCQIEVMRFRDILDTIIKGAADLTDAEKISKDFTDNVKFNTNMMSYWISRRVAKQSEINHQKAVIKALYMQLDIIRDKMYDQFFASSATDDPNFTNLVMQEEDTANELGEAICKASYYPPTMIETSIWIKTFADGKMQTHNVHMFALVKPFTTQ